MTDLRALYYSSVIFALNIPNSWITADVVFLFNYAGSNRMPINLYYSSIGISKGIYNTNTLGEKRGKFLCLST